jgi:hypothetical protein
MHRGGRKCEGQAIVQNTTQPMYEYEAAARPAELETAVPGGRCSTSYTPQKQINKTPLKMYCPTW